MRVNGTELHLAEASGKALAFAPNTIKTDKLVEMLTPSTNGNGYDSAQKIKFPTRRLRRLLLAQGQPNFERRVAVEAEMDDLDRPKAAQYVADNATGLKTKSVEEALLKRGCLAKDEQDRLYPTHAGLLLFGRDPERFFPTAEIVAVRYEGFQMSNTFARQDIRGPLPDQIRQAGTFVMDNMKPGFELCDLDWEECPTLPLDAVREIIVNAVAHRAYDEGGDSIRLLVFADRLECYSPGRLPGHVTVDNLLTERCSRNETMMQVLSEMGFVQRLGYGLDRVARRMAEEGLPAPRFEETAAGFKVTLFSRPVAWLTRQPQVEPIRKWMAQGLYERQIKTMNFVLEKGRITHRDYSKLYPDVSHETLWRDLTDLVKRDLLLRVGEGQAVFYILK